MNRMSSYATLIALTCGALPALASGSHDHGHAAGFGQPGTMAEVDRTIEVEMTDNAFSIDDLEVRPGETIRFVLHNRGDFLHEFAIATPHMHAEHEEEMADLLASGALSLDGMPGAAGHGGMQGMHGMGHDATNAVLVNPGDSAEFIWTFAETDQTIEFACTVPGHYQSGMVGPIHIGH